ncbi:MAG TPA: hypothetical protein VJR06_09375, partial [Nitrososphaerales archaeon]|nr:hypothetical protein [Nitrososphaerales archaeon]
MSKLHYLYEQASGGKEHFVYYCSSCACVLEIRQAFGPAGSFSGVCKGCGRLLEGSIECRLAPVPEEWVDAFAHPALSAQKNQALFQNASSIPHFSLGFPRLDALLRPLSKGRLVVFSGGPSSVVA